MSVSLLHQKLIQKKKYMSRKRMLQEIAELMYSYDSKDQRKWMRDYSHAIMQHCQNDDVTYSLSTRDSNNFLETLRYILSQGYVDDLCLLTCLHHTSHQCLCLNDDDICLKPH